MAEATDVEVKIDEDAQKLLTLAIQVADEAVKWTELLRAEKENGDVRATYELLQAEAGLMAVAMRFKVQRDIFHGVGEDESDDLP